MTHPVQSHEVDEPYDVIVVGAGPAGSTAAYYLATGMGRGRGKRVALLEKQTFPRDKYCGDAWCAPALDILEDMGVLQRLEAEGLVLDCTSGGLVSPSGESYVSTGEGGGAPGTRCYAIKRIICDERIARRAVEVGAELFEAAAFAEARLEDDGFWTLRCDDDRRFRGRMLLAADGAASRVARSLGVVTTPPNGVAARQYVKGGTHNFKSGGVLFYPKYVLPGYVALFRHYNDDIDLGCYLISGGAAEPGELVELYDREIGRDPFLRRVLGPNVEFLERVRVASLRTGGTPRSTARQFMAVGDAAGQTDPLTGEGIHTGMIGARIAAQTICELFERGDFSERACQEYHRRWMADFGRDFPASAIGGRMTHRFPALLDAAAVVAQRKGDGFMIDFGAAMTGVKPKTTFVRPSVALPLGIEVVRQLFIQKILRSQASEETAYASRGAQTTSRDTSFEMACLIDPAADPRPLPESPAPDRAAESELEEMFRHAGNDPAARRVLVLYGSEYGFTRDVADRVCEALAGQTMSLSPRCVSMIDYEIIDWRETPTCLLLCSTAGDGVPPADARAFFEFLESPELDLAGVRYSTLALGDRAYPHFCRAGRDLDQRMSGRGAMALAPRAEVDGDDEDTIANWIESVCRALSDPDAGENRATASPGDGLRDRARRHLAQRLERPGAPSRDQPLMARVVVKRPLTRVVEPSDREIFHIELDVSPPTTSRGNGEGGAQALSWQPGDALGVIATNCPGEVAAVLAEVTCTGEESVQPPKREGRVSLREALSHHLDIKRPSARLLEALLDRASAISEKDHAAEVRAEDTVAYRVQRELQDLLREFPSAARSLEAEDLAQLLDPLTPRYYSIASSQQTAPDRLCLAVSVVRYQLLGRPRTGLATTFLADRVAVGDRIPVFVQKNSDFRLPTADAGKPCVLIGAGTGAAPYRAFLQDLTESARRSGTTVREQAGGEPHLLFFGCRREERDFLYREDWTAWETDGALRLFPAFSRDQEDQSHLARRLLENGALVWQCMQAGHPFYLCGDATTRAPDVEQALLEIIRTCGDRSRSEAEAYLEQMRSEGHWHSDVWG